MQGIVEDANSMGMSLSKLWEMVVDRRPGVLLSMGVAESPTRLSD